MYMYTQIAFDLDPFGEEARGHVTRRHRDKYRKEKRKKKRYAHTPEEGLSQTKALYAVSVCICLSCV